MIISRRIFLQLITAVISRTAVTRHIEKRVPSTPPQPKCPAMPPPSAGGVPWGIPWVVVKTPTPKVNDNRVFFPMVSVPNKVKDHRD